MTHTMGKTLIVATLSIVSVLAVMFLLEKSEPIPIINSDALSRSGISDLDVEYSGGRIFLNVELISPKTCPELIKALGIHPIQIKSKTYQPACSVISNTRMRITYTHSIEA